VDHFPLKLYEMKMIRINKILPTLLVLPFLLFACMPQENNTNKTNSDISSTTTAMPTSIPLTPQATRPNYSPGEIVLYTVQTGDSLPALIAHFNTSEDKIRKENPVLPNHVTTLPPGLPLNIPITYRSFWGSSLQIIPDEIFINGPASLSLDTEAFIKQYPGWLNDYTEYAAKDTRNAASIIDLVSQNFSISPMVFLALIEYHSQGLSSKDLSITNDPYYLGYENSAYQGLFLQLVWAANQLNQGYYTWRSGELIEFTLPSGKIQRPDPWQNSATVALHWFFSQHYTQPEFILAVDGNGIYATFKTLYGDLWVNRAPHIPGSLEQPQLLLPFLGGIPWTFTGGPHTGWGTGAPFAALDFAPPADISGCFTSNDWVTAIADGLVLRSDGDGVIIDLDEDGNEETGWVLFYLHMSTFERVPEGTSVSTGDTIGHPSCEGGTSTGTHVHIARKYNGEWIIADSAIPFNLEGWEAIAGDAPYEGQLTKNGLYVDACICSDLKTRIISTENNLP
jgi:LasA protease